MSKFCCLLGISELYIWSNRFVHIRILVNTIHPWHGKHKGKKGATVYLVTSGATKVEIRLCFPIYFPPRFVTYPFLVSFVSKTKLLTPLNGTFWIKIRCCKRCCLNKFEAIHCIKLLWKKLIFWLQTLGWNVFCRCNVFMNIWWNSFV